MPTLEVNADQIIALLTQLPEEQRERVLNHFRTAPSAPPSQESADRLRLFQEWVRSHEDITAVVLDDSRAAIYGDGDRG